MRFFAFARKVVDGEVVVENGKEVQAFQDARLPEYSTSKAACADFFCAEEVTIPSLWHGVFTVISEWSAHVLRGIGKAVLGKSFDDDVRKNLDKTFSPTLVHTGIKACMEDDEVLEIYNRSSNPKKLGLVLGNSVGIIDKDYFECKDNDGEIMFAFYNFKPWNVTLKVGDKVGQGMFKKVLRPTEGFTIAETERVGGFGSTGK